MARHQLVGGLGIGMFVITLGQHIFFLRLKHGKTSDFFQITGKTAVT